ncbi:HipA domain-containing protein [Oerskovia turbata]|uniref:HipA domain-containing protein n=1 Tax=Oerskovia turbata TaxID=1713 RepID=A0A4Q1KU61_9CELL|nr:HipA domain-containing protein [Oerskovia turbata]RXR23769.1 HipA domain-containing protein [Oerskovia turbata]RXR33761.1 HipA domain-containing protein [Oerskovia turbata]
MFEHFKYTRSPRGCQLALPGPHKPQVKVETCPRRATLNLNLRYPGTLGSTFTLGANTPESQRSGNYSILLHEDGTVSMAPLYDAAPVFLLAPSLKHSGHALAGRTNLRHIGAAHLVRAVVSWGISEDGARQTVAELATAVARAEAPEPPVIDGIRERVAARVSLIAQAASSAGLDGC